MDFKSQSVSKVSKSESNDLCFFFFRSTPNMHELQLSSREPMNWSASLNEWICSAESCQSVAVFRRRAGSDSIAYYRSIKFDHGATAVCIVNQSLIISSCSDHEPVAAFSLNTGEPLYQPLPLQITFFRDVLQCDEFGDLHIESVLLVCTYSDGFDYVWAWLPKGTGSGLGIARFPHSRAGKPKCQKWIAIPISLSPLCILQNVIVLYSWKSQNAQNGQMYCETDVQHISLAEFEDLPRRSCAIS